MNDQELDRLVASAALIRDGQVHGLDLGHAETELLEEIMAITDTPADASAAAAPGPPTPRPSPFDRAPHRHPRLRIAVAAGLVAASLLAVVLVRSAGHEGDGEAGDVEAATQPATISPMIADPVPEGFEAAVSTFPEDGPGPAPQPPDQGIDTRVYGERTAIAVTDDIVIRAEPSAPEDTSEGTPLGEPVTVRGREGLRCSPGPFQCDFGNNVTGVSWTEDSGLRVTVESRTYDGEQVLAIAEGVVVDGHTAELGDVPAGVARPPLVAELDDDWAWGYTVAYSSPEMTSSFSVATRSETEAMHVYDLWLSGPREDTVQGHAATVEDIDGAYVLTWTPVPGQLVEVLTNGVDEAAARAFAETVRAATADEWARLQEQAASAPPDPPVLDDTIDDDPPPEGAVRRELADGAASTEVWGWRSDADELCYRVTGEHSSQVCTGEEADVLGVSPTNDDGRLIWDVPAAVGVAPEGTVSIDGGEVTFGEEVEGGRLFVWEFSEGEMPDTLTFRDDGGDEIDTADVLVF